MKLSETFKLGKKLCYPSVPSNWVCHKLARVIRAPNKRPLKSELGDDSLGKHNDHYSRKCDNFMKYYDSSAKDAYSWSSNNSINMEDFLARQIPGYHDIILNHNVDIEKGKPFDVVSWLSTYVGKGKKGTLVRNNGDVVQVENLRGKKILVCCLYVPIFWKSSVANQIRALPNKHSLLGDYELVVVPKIRRNWVDDEHAFNHFLSGLPSSALVVPFSDTLRGDFLCKSLGLVSNDPRYLLVDENQIVLECCNGEDDDSVLGTPYLDKIIPREQKVDWWKSHSQLDKILDCNPSDFVYNISPEGGKISIAELKEKLVGLYLCIDGNLIQTLNRVYEECKARNLEFEIVLVYIPSYLHGEADPQLFKDVINHALDMTGISNWWVSPLNENLSRKLTQFTCNSGGGDNVINDELIVVGPHNKFVDPYGKHVIIDYGIYAYPFTREHLVEKELEALRALKLESLLFYGSNDHLLSSYDEFYFQEPDSGRLDKISMKKFYFEKKTVLVYADHLSSLQLRRLYYPLLYWYIKYKSETYCENYVEVVFIDLDGGEGGDQMLDKAMLMPWHFCPFDPQHAAFIKKTLVKRGTAGIVAFSEYGEIITLNAEELVYSGSEPDEYSFWYVNALRHDVIKNIEYESTTGINMSDIPTKNKKDEDSFWNKFNGGV